MAGVNGIEIKVGQVWRQRDGQLVRIARREMWGRWGTVHVGEGTEMADINDDGTSDLIDEMYGLAELVEDATPQPEADSATLAEETLSALGWTFDGQAWVEHVRFREAPLAQIEMFEPPVSAPALLSAAAKHMNDRAATYDKPEGERSMVQTVVIFEAFHGIKLTEAQGWHFMQVLKDVRLFTRESYHADSAEDCIAYAALKAEAKAQEGGA